MKEKKSIEDIEKQIIKCLFSSHESSLSIKTISEWINSNWLTTLKFCRKLQDIGAVKIIQVESKSVGVKLNIEAYSLIDEAFWEAEKKEPTIFRKWIEDKRIIIVDENIKELLEIKQKLPEKK